MQTDTSGAAARSGVDRPMKKANAISERVMSFIVFGFQGRGLGNWAVFAGPVIGVTQFYRLGRLKRGKIEGDYRKQVA